MLVVGFCGAVEVMMLWMNANDGGPLEEAIRATTLTQACYYSMLCFSAAKCITGFVVYNSFKNEFMAMYGNQGVDGFWNDGGSNQWNAE